MIDFDDTLIVTNSVYHDLIVEFGEKLSDSEFVGKFYARTTERIRTVGYGPESFVITLMMVTIEQGHTYDSKLAELSVGWLKSHLHDFIKPIFEVEKHLTLLADKGHRLVLYTKGNVQAQEIRIRNSGLWEYFHHIKIVHEKSPHQLRAILDELDIEKEYCYQIGDSWQSDILPALAYDIPSFHIVGSNIWSHKEPHAEPNDYLVQRVSDFGEAARMILNDERKDALICDDVEQE